MTNDAQNPYEPTASSQLAMPTETPESVWRIRFVVSMWVCGVVGFQSIPVYPWTPEHWIDTPNSRLVGIHFAWLGAFFCSVASIGTAIGLFRLSRWMDKLGAIVCILYVGAWPGLAAVYWWLYFALRSTWI
jgi:hypothetical protein